MNFWKYFILLFILILAPTLAFAEEKTIEKTINNANYNNGQIYSFTPDNLGFTRDFFGTSGKQHEIRFREIIDIGSFVKSHGRCEEQIDRDFWENEEAAHEYLKHHPSTPCQTGKVERQIWKLISEPDISTLKPDEYYKDTNYKDTNDFDRYRHMDTNVEYFFAPQSNFWFQHDEQWKVKYTCIQFDRYNKGSCRMFYSTWDQQPVAQSDNVTSYFYNSCDIQDGEPLSISHEYLFQFNWDQDKPECMPALSDEIGTLLTSTTYTDPEIIEKSITSSNGSKTSIIFQDTHADWDGEWTNKNLIFKRRCYDKHSGCKWNSSTEAITVNTPLHNRQKYITVDTGYEDNTNNKADNVCSTEFYKASQIIQSCKYINGYLQKDQCSYNFRTTGIGEAKYPLIDKIAPEIRITPQDAENIRGNKWSFYAGNVNFDIDIRDDTRNRTQDGISGLYSAAIVIFDENGVEIAKASEIKIDESNRNKRRSDENMDTIASVWGLKKWPTKILRVGNYIIRAQATDYTGNTSVLFSQNFSVVENNLPWSYILIDHNTAEQCHKALQQTGRQESECKKVSNTGYSGFISIEQHNKNTELYNDGQKSRELSLVWYDNFFNILSKKPLKTLQLQNSPRGKNCIALNQVDNTTCDHNVNNAITTEITQENWNIFVENWGKTTSQWKSKIRTFSYAPGTFNPNYQWEIFRWNAFGEQENTTNTFTINWIPEWEIPHHFYHIFTGTMEQKTTTTLWTENDIWITLTNTEHPEQNHLNNSVQIPFLIKNFMESLKPIEETKLQITKRDSYNTTIQALWNVAQSKYIIEQTAYENNFPDEIHITSSPYVEIKILGKNNIQKLAKYFISPEKNIYTAWLSREEWGLNRIYIEWPKQSVGKDKYVTNHINILWEDSKYSPNYLRDQIYKNASYLTRNMPAQEASSHDTNNNIKYIIGKNVKLSEIRGNWDTLIIKNGNLIIDQDFNTENLNKAIIVFGDIYNSGNIFITPNVVYISAHIYADGGLSSVQNNGQTFPYINSDRSLALNKQIVFYGSIFTQNTVGWAVKATQNEAKYYLPSLHQNNILDATTENLAKAIPYDLAFLRMDNKGYDSANASRNKWRQEAVVIIFNHNFISEPLPIFNFKE